MVCIKSNFFLKTIDIFGLPDLDYKYTIITSDVIYMKLKKLATVESRFADIIWANEPITTANLVKVCEKELNWKRTTSYTVLKRLSLAGIFQNNDGVVTSILSRDEFYAKQSEIFVEENFEGSLPAFLAAFSSQKKLSKNDIEEMEKLINSYKED